MMKRIAIISLIILLIVGIILGNENQGPVTV
jgi:hypothetical protein